MKPLPNATNSLSRSLLTFGRVCRLMLVFAFLTVAASVCQAQYDDLSEDTTVDNIDSFAQQHSMLNLNGFTLTLEVTDTQSITNFFLVKGAGDKTTNIVAKTGNGALTIPQNGNIIKFNPTVNDFIIKQGTLVLERDCIYAQNVKIEQGAALTLSNVQGGASVQNLTGTGTFNVNTLEDDAVGGILKNTADSVFNGIITGNGNLRLRGDGNINHTLTLTGANTNTGLISFDIDSNSTGVLNLTLQDAAIVATCPFNGQALPVTLTYDVTSGERSITITGDTYVKNLKTIAKTGDGTLKVYSEAQDAVQAASWVISSGRIDCEGYFGSFTNGILVESGATISAGDTIGEYKTFESSITIESAAIALFEFDSYNPDEQNFDTFVIGGNKGDTFTLEDGAIVELAFLGRDAESWAKEDARYQLVKDPNFAVDKDYSRLLRGTGSNLFKLVGESGSGLFLVYNPNPVYPDVPEPSTWALLIFGVAGLLYVRKCR